jgi:hypothetical protein
VAALRWAAAQRYPAVQPKQLLHVSLVGGPHFLGARVILEVIVAVAHREAALVELHHVARRILLIYLHAAAEKRARA